MVLDPAFSTWLEPTEILRVEVFAVVFLLFAGMERVLPVRPAAWRARAGAHVALHGINVALLFGVSLLGPLTLSAAALAALFTQSGLLNQVQLGLWTKIVIAWLVLDLASYGWHRLWHRVPVLWRFHRIHHLDHALDVTTTFRTHPLETLLTLLFKCGLVFLLGVPLLGIILYELVVAVMALWIHANIRLAPALDRVLGLLFVTPGLHRVHHGAGDSEYGRNYGLVLSVWDRLFGSFHPAFPVISSGPGLATPEAFRAGTLPGLLWTPFREPNRSP